ncbi:hypothetical protein ACLOJK_015347 [Asimina triloba]
MSKRRRQIGASRQVRRRHSRKGEGDRFLVTELGDQKMTKRRKRSTLVGREEEEINEKEKNIDSLSFGREIEKR